MIKYTDYLGSSQQGKNCFLNQPVLYKPWHDPSHLYEFPVSQLPPGYHKTRGLSTITGGPTSGTIPLTAFEFYFYHFVSLLVRFFVFIFS